MKIVLVVEDEEIILNNMAAILENKNYEVYKAKNGEEALLVVEDLNQRKIIIDYIITDINMPVMDGYDFLIALRAQYTEYYIPVIFLTAYSAKVDYRKGITIGADDYLTKPFTTDELIESLIAIEKKREKLFEIYKSRTNTTIDPLTGLSNRNGIEKSIEKLDLTQVRFYYIHVRQFYKLKEILDISEIENIMINLSLRIKSSLNDNERLIYISDDSVLLISENVDFDSRCRSISRLFNTAVNSGLRNIYISVNIGVANFEYNSLITLNNSKTAVFYSINNETGNYFVYDKKIEKKGIPNIDLLISDGFNNDKFYLESQPQINLFSGKVTGVESLVRLNSDDYGTIYPDNFIWVCELNGLIDNLGDVVLKKACQTILEFEKQGLKDILVAVNFSGKQLSDNSVVKRVKDIIGLYEINPSFLEFEITETVMISNQTMVRSILDEFKKMGIKIALDDFGTGYSTFSYLTKFPVDRIKIDKSFINDISFDVDLQRIVKTIIDLAHDMKIEVVAEGVENEDQLEALCDIGCDIIQGYYFSKPKKFEDLVAYIKEKNFV
ncbi:MAG: hypothetical protein A2015_04360 [Spirochaetes bacterium GWF1_31_7]|nr:MAG: hypothetical protein A2Y30_16910 [Spirochaetes bacterium GWE1_32_154]OHD52586.1 MAG: hypothetical protein A2Y29_00040 [Spirochaetes bacterium GWE2_31_10]OHD52954.1 MAG: hypothetical protein A2015_04360 [Spirochaetes bacterium GWF1_31_7]HBD93697.1 hypothetical protein [Spirochaetia bacterium]HBI37201.1 hypothetical protein [Spirochaetia bacterium]